MQPLGCLEESHHMSLDAFKRLVSYAAVFFLVVPFPAAAMTLTFSNDRTFVVASAILDFGIGVALRLASRRIRTDLRSGQRLVEYCFYLFSLVTLAGFVYKFFADPDLFRAEILLNLFRFAGTVAVLIVIKKTIDGIKARNLTGQPL
jgi:hypothetical protein